jgi:hypothetical protein
LLFVFFVKLETFESFNSFFLFEQDAGVSPKDFAPVKTGIQDFNLIFFEGTRLFSEHFVIDLIRMLDFGQFKRIEYVHFES